MVSFLYKFCKFFYPIYFFTLCTIEGIKNPNNLMFVLFEKPFYKSNTIKTKEGKNLYIDQIRRRYKNLKEEKTKNPNYINDFKKNHDVEAKYIEMFDKNFIEIGPNDYRINGFYKNSNKNNLFVFFHGVGMTVFRELFIGERAFSLKNYFQNDFDILIPEYPGTSINDHRNNKKNFDKMIDIYAKWIRDNYNGKKIIIDGHSFGCWLALSLANKLPDQDINIILNNPFINNQTASIWSMSHYVETLVKFLITKEFENDVLIKNLKENHNVNIFIIANKKDEKCSYVDSISLKSLNEEKIIIMHALKDSRGHKYKSHREINFEENFLLALSLKNNNFTLNDESYIKALNGYNII